MSKKIFLPSAFARPLGLLFLVLFSGLVRAGDQHSVPLETFMRQVQQEYGIYFSYQADSLKQTIVVYSDPDRQRERNPEKVLSSVLKPVGLTYAKVNNVYVISLAAIKS